MAETQETIADIIAQKRRRADEIERDCAEKMKRGEIVSDRYTREVVADIRRDADRFEAAWKRELARVDSIIDEAVHGYPPEDINDERELLTKPAENVNNASASDSRDNSGNAAKLREAMIKVLEYIESFHKYITPDKGKELTVLFTVADTIRDKARAALAEPPRNCDIAQDWLRDLYVNFKPPASVKREMPPEWVDAIMAFCRWLVAPAAKQEGGAE